MGLYVMMLKIGSHTFVKVGVTEGDPVKRMGNVANGCPVRPELVAFDPQATRDHEQQVHRRLAHWRSHLEWFHYTGDVVCFVSMMRGVFPVAPRPDMLKEQERDRLANIRTAMRLARRMTVRGARIGQMTNGQEDEEERELGSNDENRPIIVNRYRVTPTLRPWLVDPPPKPMTNGEACRFLLNQLPK